MARILVFTPTYDDMLRPETVASVTEQRFNGELVHRFDDRDLYPGRSGKEVTAKYQSARQMALDEGFDALLTVEHDMRLPDGCVRAMWDTPAYAGAGSALVVYAVYLLRHGPNKVLSAWQWTGGRNLGMSLSLYPQELERYRRQGWGRVCGVGFGCTLIRRDVLERIPFREDGDGGAGDLPFATDCIRAGIEPIARFDTVCDHYHEGVWLRAFQEGAGVVIRVLALQNVTALIGGVTTAMKEGHYYSASVEEANELARAGYVQAQTQERETTEASTAEERETAVAPQTRKRTTRKAKNAAA